MIYQWIIFITSLLLLASCSGGGGGGGGGSAAPAPVQKVSFVPNSSDIHVNEGSSTAVVVLLSEAAPQDLHLTWSMIAGPGEFVSTSGSFNIAKGGSSGTFQINSLDDNRYEGSVTYTLTVGGPENEVSGTLALSVILNNTTSAAAISVVEGSTYNFGLAAVGDVVEKVLTLSNAGEAEALSLVSSLASPFRFKGGAYPGTGGSCGATLDGGSTCTVVIEFAPSTANTYSQNLSFDYNSGPVAHEILNFNLQGQSISFSPVISGYPTGRSLSTSLNVSVTGPSLDQYKFKVGTSASVNCQDNTGYSVARSTGVNITDDISALSDGAVKLCVITHHTAGVWQSGLVAFETTWTKDTTAPTFTGLSDDSVWKKSKTWSWGCAGDDTCTYRFVVDQNPVTDISLQPYGSTTSTSQSSGNGDFYLHIQAKDAVGLESPVAHILAKLDNTNPTVPASITHNLAYNSTSSSPSMTWATSTDAHSGISAYELSVGTTPGGVDILNWTNVSNVTAYQISSLVLEADYYYYINIRAKDAADNYSSVLTSDGWLVDLTPPQPPALCDDGFMTPSITTATATWSTGSDGQSGVASYQVAVGTSGGATNVLNWTDVGLVLSATVNVTLTKSQMYFFSVRTVDVAGNVSSPRNGDGWIAMGLFTHAQKISDSTSVSSGRHANRYNYFGQAVAISEDGQTMVVGIPNDDTDANGLNYAPNAGAAQVFVKSGGNWVFSQKLAGFGTNGRMANDNFGYSVAIYGDTIAVGAPYQDYDASGGGLSSNTGAVYIYKYSGGVWNNSQKIVGTGTNGRVSGDQFGWSLSLDIDTLAVGVVLQDYDETGVVSTADAGAVYVYYQTVGVFTLQQRIVGTGSNGRNSGDQFGHSVSINGNDLIIGARYQDSDGSGGNVVSNAGAAFIFTRSGSTWSLQQKIAADSSTGRAANDYFGWSVSIKNSKVLIGAPYQDTDASGLNSVADAGAAYVFSRSGSVWTQEAKLIPSGTNMRRASDYFGSWVQLGLSGVNPDYAIVSSPTQDYDSNGANASSNTGVLYTFTYSGSWSQSQKLSASGTAGRGYADQFGFAFAYANSEIVIGVPYQDYDSSGANYVIDGGAVYGYSGLPGAFATQTRVVEGAGVSLTRAGNSFANYGQAIAISEDQSTMVVGAPNDSYDASNANFVNAAGAVYVYIKSGGSWVFQQKLVGVGTNGRMVNDYFGYSVAISGDTIAVGAYAQDYNESGASSVGDAGAVYVFTRSGSVWSLEQKLVGSGTNGRVGSDYYGWSVAISGNMLAVGALYQDYDDTGANILNNAGAAYVYQRSGSVWTLDRKFVGNSLSAGTNSRIADDNFGYSVAITSDSLLVGAPTQDYDSVGANAATNAGAVYAYKYSGGTWSFVKKVVAVGTNARVAGDQFGYSIALSGTGTGSRLVVGAPYHDYDANGANAVTDAGGVYVYSKTAGGNWNSETKLVGFGTNGRLSADYFGARVSASNEKVVVGAYGQDYDQNGANNVSAAGAAYFFFYSGGMWINHQKLIAEGTNARIASDEMGIGVCVSGDSLAVGVRKQEYDSNGTNISLDHGALHTYQF